MRKLFFLVLLLMLPVLGFASTEEKKSDEESGPVIEYIDMWPKFTVNLAEPKKYLMVNIQLLVEGADNVEKVKKHMPMLRHEMIMMLSGMHVSELETMEQREGLRLKAKQLVIDSLIKIKNSDGFRDLFFSEFLIN